MRMSSSITQRHRAECPALPAWYAILGGSGTMATFGPPVSQLRPDLQAAHQATNIISVWLEGRSFAPTAAEAKPENAIFYQGWAAHVSKVGTAEVLTLTHPDVEVVNMVHWLLYCVAVHTDECSLRPPDTSCHHVISLVCTCSN